MNVLKKFGKIANHQVFFWRINEKKGGGGREGRLLINCAS
jgi:hypothetical protein